jgi:outer membrane receptor protein involved in Fe transport
MRHPLFGSAALLLTACACAQDIQQVNVAATKLDARERDTLTAIVIGHDEIMRQGDSNLADVLKRQGGITIDAAPGQAGVIRMRGMGAGYAAILLNGLPAPSGFTLESLAPELIERIEIARAGSAEYSNQAIAGSINVVLRKAGPRTQSELKAGSAASNDRLSPTLGIQTSGQRGALAFTLAATLRRNSTDTPSTARELGSGPALARVTATGDRFIEDSLELAPRLTWQLTPTDTLSSQSLLRQRHLATLQHNTETTQVGSASAFPQSASRYDAHPVNGYSDLAWARKIDGGARFDVKLAGFYSTRRAGFDYRGMDSDGALAGVHHVDSGPTESDASVSGSYRRPLGDKHALAVGWELGSKRRSEFRRERQYDGAGAQTLASDEQFSASVRRMALFAQDEWDITPSWSLYLGLRREALRTTGAGNAHVAVDVGAGVWSPLAQTLWKLASNDNGATRDQLRLALGRSYKPPQIVQLMPRRYTIDNGNSPTNPDLQGNPGLRPELAWNLDAAWERYVGKDGMVSVSAYLKRIRDITLDRLYQVGATWVNLPDNQGNALLHGVEIEAKFSWRLLAVRANAARNWSRLDQVPGPDNRLDGQPPLSATLGADSASAGSLSGGASFSYRSAVATRSAATTSFGTGPKRELDLYAVWKHDGANRLRLSLTNLLHQAGIERAAYDDGASALARTVTTRSFASVRIVWEHGL